MIADRMQQFNRLKTHYCMISVLTLYIVIAVSRLMNRNITTGATIRAKQGTELGDHKLLTNYQTGFGYEFRRTNGWYTIQFFWVEFMNAPKRNPLKRDQQSSRCRSS